MKIDKDNEDDEGEEDEVKISHLRIQKWGICDWLRL